MAVKSIYYSETPGEMIKAGVRMAIIDLSKGNPTLTIATCTKIEKAAYANSKETELIAWFDGPNMPLFEPVRKCHFVFPTRPSPSGRVEYKTVLYLETPDEDIIPGEKVAVFDKRHIGEIIISECTKVEGRLVYFKWYGTVLTSLARNCHAVVDEE